MMKINKVAVLGAGVMGSALACHMANAGLSVILLDIVGKDKNGSVPTDKKGRNAHTQSALSACIKSKPAPLFAKSLGSRIEVGNLDDDLNKIADCDWILEVIIENLEIKRSLYERIEDIRKKGTIITSNTSGIPIHMLSEGRSEDFRSHFFGSHFFNPPRYLTLLEVISGPDTKPALLDQFSTWATSKLGKEIVRCKDRPAFVANRIGVFAMSYIYSIAHEMELPISIVDKLTGKAIARPSTGTFRLGDLVGLDVAHKVMSGIKSHCPDDAMVQALSELPFMNHLIENKWLGNKTKQGFYKKTKERDANGKTIIQELDLKSLEYVRKSDLKLESLGKARKIDDAKARIQYLFNADDEGGKLVKKSMAALFAYASQRVPDIADDLYEIDKALRCGFNWTYGPFEYWDIVGVQAGIDAALAEGFTIPEWVTKMVASGQTNFYQRVDGSMQVYDPNGTNLTALPRHKNQISLHTDDKKPLVYQNDEVHLHDIGDGVLCLEFKSKMNAIGQGILDGINESITLAEEQGWKGIVIGNHAEQFTVGANLMLIGMMAFQQQYEMLNMAVKLFQDTSMRCRYSKIPIVVATQGYVFGGGCEISMHCDGVAAAAESYIGLVEVGVGLIPGGGGTKEFAMRMSDRFGTGDVEIPSLIEYFKTIATASVATSAKEAFDLHYLLPERDRIIMNKSHNIGEAKAMVLGLSENYSHPVQRNDIKVLGRSGLGALYVAANELKRAGWASEHDIKIAHKIAYVMCGGDLSEKEHVSEQYLLDIEREAFLSLCTEQKTMERIQHMLEKNKPLRN